MTLKNGTLRDSIILCENCNETFESSVIEFYIAMGSRNNNFADLKCPICDNIICYIENPLREYNYGKDIKYLADKISNVNTDEEVEEICDGLKGIAEEFG